MGRTYDEVYKVQAVKLAEEIGVRGAIEELQVPEETLRGWIEKKKKGELDTGNGSRKPEESLNIVQQLQEARRQLKEQEKEIRRLKELNEFL